MLDGTVLAPMVLIMTALAMIAWARWQPRARGELPRLLMLAALGLTCGVAASAMFAGPTPWPELFWGDAWARITVTAFLGLAVLWALMTWRASAPADAALDLLSVSGGALALAARDGFLCWVGAALLGVGAMLYGLALLYYRTGTLDLAGLNRWLWAQGGPPDLIVLAGVALTLGGLSLMMGLLPPYTGDRERDPLTFTLGLMLLARLCHTGFAALADAWRNALIVAGLIAWTWGGFTIVRRGMNYYAPTVMQRGFLLVALGLSTQTEHWPGFWLALAAYALGQGIFGALCHATSGAEQPFAGLLWVKPALGAPLLVALVSLAGLPPLLGFVSRARLIWAAWGERWVWLAALSALASAMTAARYWPFIAALTRRTPTDRQTVVAAPLQIAVGLALGALALIALGLYPTLVDELARRMMW